MPHSTRLITPAVTGVLLGATVLGFAFTLGCRRATKSSEAERALSVQVIKVEPQPLEETLETTGSLVSSVAVDVKTQFPGRLLRMLKQEGDRVTRGELLAQLEETDAALAVGQTKAALEVAQATLERARVAADHAASEKARAEKLLASGGITDKDYEAAQMAERDAVAQTRLAEAQVEQARQALAMAQKRLDDCRLVSPIDGEVERKYFNPGSWVDGNALLYKLVNNQRLELETPVSSAEMARLAKGQTIRFQVAAYPNDEFKATILTIGGAVQEQNRATLVRAGVNNEASKLKAGMFAKGKIVLGRKPAALVVPSSGVIRRVGQRPIIYVVESGRAQAREVVLGIEQPSMVEITSGLAPGEVVVAEQYLELAGGMPVSPRQ